MGIKKDLIPQKFYPITKLQANGRFEIYKGLYRDKPVSIKVCVDKSKKDRLSKELAGLLNMNEIDPKGITYKIPGAIELTSDYIATDWIDGTEMIDDFDRKDIDAINKHLKYLVNLYVFMDQRSNGQTGVTQFNREGFEDTGNSAIIKLKKLNYQEWFDPNLAEQVSKYISDKITDIETRFTNGDLQPGNMIIIKDGGIALIDFETCSWLWPRHYNIVNLVFNYSIKYPWVSDILKAAFIDYCDKLQLNALDNTDAFNISAAARSLQILIEKPKSSEISTYSKDCMNNILSGKLFFKQN